VTFHFIGIAGTGMRPLALLALARGQQITGSDRLFDQGGASAIRGQLEAAGARIVPQDGAGVVRGLEAVVVSSAIELQVPDYLRAKELGIPIIHRAEFLARVSADLRTLAVAGTSGKSTVTAMIAFILTHAGFDPTVICGGDLLDFSAEGLPTGFRLGGSSWAVFETDESDGSLLKFHPTAGVLTNVSEDHKPLSEVKSLFRQFMLQCREQRIVGVDCPVAQQLVDGLPHISYGLADNAQVRPAYAAPLQWGSDIEIDGERITLQVPGMFNVQNALAAWAAARIAGVPRRETADALSRFHGLRRRMQVVFEANGIRVIDDFAHNPDKIAAAIATLQPRCRRLAVIFQPHGFGPLRMMGDAFVHVFQHGLRSDDRLIMCPVFYAGGTVARDVSSADVTAPLAQRGVDARTLDRGQIPDELAQWAKAGDLIAIMGARDDTLTALAQNIARRISGEHGSR